MKIYKFEIPDLMPIMMIIVTCLLLSSIMVEVIDNSLGPDKYEVDGDICESKHTSFGKLTIYDCLSGNVYTNPERYRVIEYEKNKN